MVSQRKTKLKATEFCYWLQGFFELNGINPMIPEGLTAPQVQCIKNHLNMVFIHDIDPKYPQKAALDVAHNPPPFGGKPKLRC